MSKRERQLRHKFYIQKRTLIKDYCPGYYDLVSGGVVAYGESDEENACRELEEEMGIKKSEGLKLLWRNKYEDASSRSWGAVFLTKYDGKITPQPEEVEEVELWSQEEIDAKIKEGLKITPDSIALWRQLQEKLSNGELTLECYCWG